MSQHLTLVYTRHSHLFGSHVFSKAKPELKPIALSAEIGHNKYALRGLFRDIQPGSWNVSERDIGEILSIITSVVH